MLRNRPSPFRHYAVLQRARVHQPRVPRGSSTHGSAAEWPDRHRDQDPDGDGDPAALLRVLHAAALTATRGCTQKPSAKTRKGGLKNLRPPFPVFGGWGNSILFYAFPIKFSVWCRIFPRPRLSGCCRRRKENTGERRFVSLFMAMFRRISRRAYFNPACSASTASSRRPAVA